LQRTALEDAILEAFEFGYFRVTSPKDLHGIIEMINCSAVLKDTADKVLGQLSNAPMPMDEVAHLMWRTLDHRN